eukprot:5946875-Pyramimonas_sp.AAC.1
MIECPSLLPRQWEAGPTQHLDQRDREVDVARLTDAGGAVEGSEQDLHAADHSPLKENPGLRALSLGLEGDAG